MEPVAADNKKAPDIGALKRVMTSHVFRRQSLSEADDRLRSVLHPKIREDEQLGAGGQKLEGETLLLKTCQLIGKKERIRFSSGFAKSNEAWEPLKKITRASNVRNRTVHLQETWWLSDQGSLLGYLKADRSPVALLRKGRRYQLVNLATGERTAVGKQTSALLEPEAISFFSPLPSGRINALDLLTFALAFSRTDVVLFFLLGIVSALLALLVPIISGYIFNTIIPGNRIAELWQISALLIAVVLVMGIINFTKSIAVLRFEGISSYKLQSAVWDRILSLKVPFFRNFDPGNLAERSMGIEKIRTILSANVMGAVVSAIFSLFYLGLMIYYDLYLALLALLLGTIVALFTLSISMLAYKHVAGYMRMEAIISGFMMMMLRGIQKIRLTNTGEKVFNIWADKFAQQEEHYANKQRLLIVAAIFTFGFPVLASMLIYLRIFDLLTAQDSLFRIGDFIAFNTAYLSFQGALINAFMVTVPVMSIKPAFELLRPILQAEPEDYTGKKDPGELRGDIEISNLRFRYPDTQEYVLNGVNLKIQAGEYVALVGGSGSGKSTLLRVLLGFEEYQSGTVLYDRTDLNELDIRTIRDQIGVVLQNGKIMQGTVLYNIIGSASYSEQMAWQAAEMAGCRHDIEMLENGMHTVLPAGGGTLSGGQQQRIIIARALIKKPKILFFDEATSALDNNTQRTVTANVEQLEATKVVIAHRLSTIKQADRIIVLDRGVIAEQGSFQELLDQQGLFYNLAKNQLS